MDRHFDFKSFLVFSSSNQVLLWSSTHLHRKGTVGEKPINNIFFIYNQELYKKLNITYMKIRKHEEQASQRIKVTIANNEAHSTLASPHVRNHPV